MAYEIASLSGMPLNLGMTVSMTFLCILINFFLFRYGGLK